VRHWRGSVAPRLTGTALRAALGRVGGTPRPRLAVAALLACLLGGGLAALLVVLLGGHAKPAPRLVPRLAGLTSDPLAFAPAQRQSLEQAAARGYAQVLYAKSPGGVVASARRTARYRSLVEQAVAGTGIDPDLLEAIVFLESAGRPDVIAGSDPASAAGLTQILAETAKDFLGMHVDLTVSRYLTDAIAAAQRRGDPQAARRLEARRRRVDARFDPAKALAGTVRYLLTARKRFGRDDLAVVSYHMGIGNLQNVLRDYAGKGGTIEQLVARNDLSWARVYFASSPVDHRSAWARLAGFGDDSQTYYWRVLAAEQIMRLYRSDPSELQRLAVLQREKASAEDVLHPPATTERFATAGQLEHAWSEGVVQPLPNEPAVLHVRVAPTMGALADRLGKQPDLYRGLRPDALALLLYLAGRVHALSGAPALTVSATVLDDQYRQLLPTTDPEAGTGYSVLTTGYAFDVRRTYTSPAQAAAFQYELERLQARDLIAWIRTPTTIHVTVSSAAGSLVPVLLRTVPAGSR
jgi:soluble lytic murein transglycosylase-like protein